MLLVVNAAGECWDGHSWTAKGRPFLSEASAIRSLHEQGEDPGDAEFIEVSRDPS